MRLRIHLSAFVIAACALLGMAGCDDNDEDEVIVSDAMFDDIDVNDDFVIDDVEWASINAFWDLDGDGLLTQAEFLPVNGFEVLDLDDDGFLTDVEFNAAIDEFDLDNDGFLDADEFDLGFF